MDLIILKNVNVNDIKALGLVSFLESELSMPEVNPVPTPTEYVAPKLESLAPSDVEPPKQMEMDHPKKGRGRLATKKADAPGAPADPAPEPVASEPAPAPVTEEQIRELCKTAIKSGIKHEVVVQTFQEFAPDATLIAQVPEEHWPALAARLQEVTNASQ